MKSPFPGMDPYLEYRWGTVHFGLCASILSLLQPLLPVGLRARAEQDVALVDVDPSKHQTFAPDVSVVEVRTTQSGATSAAVLESVAPVVLQVQTQVRRRWIELIDTADGKRVVTAIEVLSPGNKAAGQLNRDYRRKLRRYVAAGTSVVEIDLLRSSRRHLAVTNVSVPRARQATYYTCVCRAWRPDLWAAYPMPLRDSLPVVPVPCRRPDEHVPLDLQAVFDRMYADGGHDDLDYAVPPDPPLNDADAAWVQGLIAHRPA